MKHKAKAGSQHPVSGLSYPPDKGGKGGYISYNKTLKQKTRKNRKNPTSAEKILSAGGLREVVRESLSGKRGR